ncbi:acyl CoA:acetate/3-ketoacid CoA transferase [Saccharopolyspora hattusasensis]|uniref:acyl CoA:acetate/3-ketoacid CoA transferase n=1 Tax=Saccharopolyspora hattusasensis TaxID=1128679 RepID=UPI003D95517F
MKFCSATEAAALVPDAATVFVDGSGGGVNEPDEILAALECRFIAEQAPRDLTVVHVSGMGDGMGSGLSRFAHPGMTRRVIGGHWGWSKPMQDLAMAEQIEAYCLPQGTLSQLVREIAGHRPGVLTKIGLGTFVDPRQHGGRLNTAAKDDIVHLAELSGEEWLFTPAFPIDVAIIRGSVADEHGNISMDDEGLFAETLSAAQAAKNTGGVVIAQVRAAAAAGALDPRRVKVPSPLVDAVVVAPQQRLSAATTDDPYLTGRLRHPGTHCEPMPLTVRKVIARRAALELVSGDVINLGFGMPDGVAAVLAEEGLSDQVIFTVEQGHIGGVPAGGSDFGLCRSPHATIDAGYQFDWYDGGGLDVAVLSFAQVDPEGNVNVGRFGGRVPGVGGFINISQGTHRVVFVGTFVAGAECTLDGLGGITIHGGATPKFVDEVEQISFSGARAASNGQDVRYVTERAVFGLVDGQLTLVEIAEGLDLERDVVAQMGFRPKIAPQLRTVDPAILRNSPMNLMLPKPTGGAR